MKSTVRNWIMRPIDRMLARNGKWDSIESTPHRNYALPGEFHSPGGIGMMKHKGFSLIELLIVVAIILIIAAIAIPNLLRSKIAANESSAVGSVRTINTAEVTYSSTWGTGYTALAPLGGAAPCTAAAATACLIDPLLSAGTKSGYTFQAAGTLANAGINNGFEVNGTPAAYQSSGVRSFCSDQTGVIKFSVNAGAQIGIAAGTCSGVATNPGVSGPIGN
ncbi:MAG TPA: prepilin-type N-terminal cleavage/methylation domain-containing protein [Candidatus Dormibacteraeota bacterium]|nr:prepilin-type N-terminal cleavage/methylation domain-containing protein [Candidatus Dormibacteraeota bacterium]